MFLDTQELTLSEKELSGIIFERIGDNQSFGRIRIFKGQIFKTASSRPSKYIASCDTVNDQF